ncbi:MAG: leucine-rich repeat domain-containing protein [Alphaproteobacteria bacterium]|nr:leucine-rich repeat domain-containing protein [Alphaproteobacteria bacterium]
MFKKILLLLSLLSINGAYLSYAADDPISSEEKYSGKRKRSDSELTDTELPLNKKQKTELTEEKKELITNDFLKDFVFKNDIDFNKYKNQIMSGVLIMPAIDISKQIIDKMSNLTWLTHLSFKNSPMSFLPDAVINLTNLTHLDISNSKFNLFEYTTKNLTNLTHLNASNTHKGYFTDAITHLSNLTYLDLSNNEITYIPDTIGNLKNLTDLNLYNNRLIQLPDSIENLSKLKNLTLGAEEKFQNLPDLRTTKEKERLIDEFLSSFGDKSGFDHRSKNELKRGVFYFERAKINQDQLKKLFSFTWLININIKNCTLDNLPDNINNLINLQQLTLRNCNINYLPDNIGNLLNLEELDLSENPLGALHSAVTILPNLKTLKINKIRMDYLPSNMEGLKSLEVLEADFNNLEYVSNSIGDLKQLKELSLQNNNIEEIHENIGNLENLKKFDISYNPVKTLHSFIGKLINLTHFNLIECTELLYLPSSVENLRNIVLLDLTAASSLIMEGDEETLGARDLRDIFQDRVLLNEDEDEDEEPITPIKKKDLYQCLDEEVISVDRKTIKDYKMPDVIDLKWDAVTFIENWNKLLNLLILDGENALSYKLLANDFSEDSSLEDQQLSNKEKIEKFIFPRLNGFVKTLWEIPLAENEKSGWQMYSNSISELRKNISYIVSRLIEDNLDSETRHVLMSQITNALFHCPTGQKEGISLILVSLLTERKNDEIIDEIFKILAIEKNILFKTAILPGNSSQNVHILSYYFDKLKDELGLTSNFESFDEKIGIMGRDPFGGHKGNALSAFYTAFNPDHIVKVIMDNIESEEDWHSRQRLSDLDNPPSQEESEKIDESLLKAEKYRRIKISDILGHLKSIGIITQSFSGGVLRTNGWEPYFKNDPNGDKFTQPTIEGIEAILVHMNILKRKS